MFEKTITRKIKCKFVGLLKRRSIIYDRRCKRICDEVINKKAWGSLKPVDAGADFVVSLATIPARFQKIIPCLVSIFMQETMPAAVYLCVADKFSDADFPAELIEFKKRGLTIVYCKDDVTKPHTKYFYTAKAVKDKRILTLDDDLYYNFRTLTSLVTVSAKCPNAIVCNRCHNVTYKKGKLLPYNSWLDRNVLRGNENLFITGVGGVLYPMGFFDDDVLDLNKIAHCLYQDDAYLTVMARVKKTSIRKTMKFYIEQIAVDGSQEVALNKTNVGMGRNDSQIRSLLDFLELDDTVFLAK